MNMNTEISDIKEINDAIETLAMWLDGEYVEKLKADVIESYKETKLKIYTQKLNSLA